MTITEFGASIGKGPRQVRKALRDAGLLQTEIEVRDRGDHPPEYLHTTRLTPKAVSEGLGRRLDPHEGGPYDVLTTKGQQLAANRLKGGESRSAINKRRVVRETVHSMIDAGHPQAEIVRRTGLSRSLVSYHAGRLAA